MAKVRNITASKQRLVVRCALNGMNWMLQTTEKPKETSDDIDDIRNEAYRQGAIESAAATIQDIASHFIEVGEISTIIEKHTGDVYEGSAMPEKTFDAMFKEICEAAL